MKPRFQCWSFFFSMEFVKKVKNFMKILGHLLVGTFANRAHKNGICLV